MDAYLDASCLAALALKDGHWLAIRDWMIVAQPEFQFSDFCWGEVVSAIGNRYRSRSIDPEQAAGAIVSVQAIVARWERHRMTSADIDKATTMVADFRLGLRLPDAIHLAIACRTGGTLVTADRIQAKAAAALGISCLDPTRLENHP